jgi:hypothetical protein
LKAPKIGASSRTAGFFGSAGRVLGYVVAAILNAMSRDVSAALIRI